MFFFGNEQLAQGLMRVVTPSFDALVREGYKIGALVLPSENTKKPLKIAEVAYGYGVPVFYTRNSGEILELVREKKPDIGVLASFGKIIPQAVIEAFPMGILNIHPSLLPKYRGTTPIESAILNGDKETGVSVMGLVKEMDAGPVFAQEKVTLRGNETKQELYERLARLGWALLIRVLGDVVRNNVTGVEQNNSQATFTKKLEKKDGNIAPNEFSAVEIERQIRAYAGFPKSKYEFFGVPCTVIQGHIEENVGSGLEIECKDGRYLSVDRLVPAGRKEMSATEFLRGYAK